MPLVTNPGSQYSPQHIVRKYKAHEGFTGDTLSILLLGASNLAIFEPNTIHGQKSKNKENPAPPPSYLLQHPHIAALQGPKGGPYGGCYSTFAEGI